MCVQVYKKHARPFIIDGVKVWLCLCVEAFKRPVVNVCKKLKVKLVALSRPKRRSLPEQYVNRPWFKMIFPATDSFCIP